MQSIRYKDYNSVLRTFLNERTQKISINAGFTCPNRDGKAGIDGCTYCNNQTFNPDYCMTGKSVTEQIEEGIRFFSRKHNGLKYLAYFQAYTNTYANPEKLHRLYEEALQCPNVIGLVVATRPDCVDDNLLNYLYQLSQNHYVMIEYGVESTSDDTLQCINRGHTFACAQKAIIATAQRGIHTAAHLILGLPHEDRQMMLEHAVKLSKLPLTTLKLHQLQLIKGTVMTRQYTEHPEWFHFFTMEEYIDLCIDFLELLSPDIAIERFTSQSPQQLVVAPKWDAKNYEFVSKLQKRMIERDTFQGANYFG